MHIGEGILPVGWAAAWFAPAAVFVLKGIREIQRRAREVPITKPFLGVLGAAVFIISLLPIPVPIAGTTAHPAGTPLAAILVGPFISTVLAGVALFLQALFFAHGGLTTLGANIFSEGVVGSFIGYAVFLLAKRGRLPLFWTGVLVGFLGDLSVYLTTSLQLALALHGHQPVLEAMFTFFAAYLPAQLPLAILEGVFTGLVLRFVAECRPDILSRLRIWVPEKGVSQ